MHHFLIRWTVTMSHKPTWSSNVSLRLSVGQQRLTYTCGFALGVRRFDRCGLVTLEWSRRESADWSVTASSAWLSPFPASAPSTTVFWCLTRDGGSFSRDGCLSWAAVASVSNDCFQHDGGSPSQCIMRSTCMMKVLESGFRCNTKFTSFTFRIIRYGPSLIRCHLCRSFALRRRQ